MANVPLKSIKFPGLENTYTVPQIDTTLALLGYAAESRTVGNKFAEVDALTKLLSDNVPNTVQEYAFSGGSVSQVTHKSGNTTIRTDAFSYGNGTITETRTLNTGEQLAIVTNLATLETTVTFTAS